MDELILIVDDNERNLKLVRDVLRHPGFRTSRRRPAAPGYPMPLANTYLT